MKETKGPLIQVAGAALGHTTGMLSTQMGTSPGMGLGGQPAGRAANWSVVAPAVAPPLILVETGTATKRML